MLLGSVSQRVLRTVPVPVLVVPPGAAADEDGLSDGEPLGEESSGEGP